jgi:DNA-binding transcriptional LysR family regulator
MKLHSPSMPELHAFVVAARLGSFTLAARELSVTQGAISRAVARLEEHFGVQLVQRNARKMELTKAGKELLRDVEAPLVAIEKASARRRTRTNELVLSAVPTLASTWLVPRLPDFHRRHPETRIRFVPYRKGEDFTGGEPDAALLTGMADSWPGLDCTYVIGREIVPLCHPARLQARRWKRPADLAREPLLSHTTSPDRWSEWLTAAGARNAQPNVAGSFDQVSILLRAAIADMGVIVVSRCLAREAVESGRLVIPFDLPIESARGFFLCAPPRNANMPAFREFRQWLLEMAKEDLARPLQPPA